MAEKVDYAAALRECGFDERAVASGVRMLEADVEPGAFKLAVSMLQVQGHRAGVRDHQIDPIVTRVAAQEARAAIGAHGARARARMAVVEAERDDRNDELQRVMRESSDAMAWLLENMTDDELDNRVSFRPHIAEAWREFLQLEERERELRVGQAPIQSRAADRVTDVKERRASGSTPVTGD